MVKHTPAAFFSYCRADSEFALRLAEDLKAAGANVWIDELDIAPGQPWDRAVEDALNTCSQLLVILSPDSANSNNVRDEVSFAFNKQKAVIPVLYRECNIPFRLDRLQRIDFRTDYPRGVKALLKALGVDRPADGSIPTSSDVPKERQSNMTEPEADGPAVDQAEVEESKASGRSESVKARRRFFRLLTRGQLPPLKRQLKDAQSIDMSGMSLLGVATNISTFLEHVRRGCRVRLLLLDPDNESLMQMIEPFIPSHNVPDQTRAIRLSLAYLEGNRDLFTSDLVQIRLYDRPLAHAMLIINRDMPDARLRVEMYMRNREPADSPGFYILRKDEPGWFGTFAAEFDDHWANAALYSPSATK